MIDFERILRDDIGDAAVDKFLAIPAWRIGLPLGIAIAALLDFAGFYA